MKKFENAAVVELEVKDTAEIQAELPSVDEYRDGLYKQGYNVGSGVPHNSLDDQTGRNN